MKRAVGDPPVAPLRMYGGPGYDRFSGAEGKEVIYAGPGGSDTFTWRSDDVVIGGVGRDVVRVEENNDRVRAKAGADTVFGGQGRDRLKGGDGNDVVYTTALLAAGGDGNLDYANCGRGRDTVYYEERRDHIESNCEKKVPY